MKQEICKLNDIPADGSRIVPFFGRELQVWKAGDRFRAAANVCLHLGGPLECKDGALECPWHGARWDMKSGRRIEGPGPADAKLMFLPTRVEGDALVYVWEE